MISAVRKHYFRQKKIVIIFFLIVGHRHLQKYKSYLNHFVCKKSSPFDKFYKIWWKCTAQTYREIFMKSWTDRGFKFCGSLSAKMYHNFFEVTLGPSKNENECKLKAKQFLAFCISAQLNQIRFLIKILQVGSSHIE